MGDNDSDILQQVQYYRKVVLMYEALDEEIDTLIMAHGGTSDQMPPEDLTRYRDLRGAVLNLPQGSSMRLRNCAARHQILDFLGQIQKRQYPRDDGLAFPDAGGDGFLSHAVGRFNQLF